MSYNPYNNPYSWTGSASRKRKAAAAYMRLVPAGQRRRTSARMFARPRAPGYIRTSGYFGRFNRGGAYSRLRANPFVRRADVEKKFHDVTIADATTGTTWEESTSQNLIAQGTTEVQRIGRKVVVKDIHMRGEVLLSALQDSAAIGEAVHWRLLLVLDKQANGANAAVGDVIETTTNINSFNNLANKDRFKILWQTRDTLNSTGASGTGVTGDHAGDVKIIEYHKKVNIPIEFDSTTGAITEIKSNNLFWMFCRSQAGGTVTLNMVTRLRFTDL